MLIKKIKDKLVLLKFNYSNNKKISAFLKMCVVGIMFSSCAQVVAPGGGARDITPPKILKYSPDSAQLNFASKNIEITFDEFIQLKDLNSQLLISPPLARTPDVTIKNKTLNIELDKNETLKPNTTYCISFGNAVQDLNEGNPIENFKYIFSTGTFIDSLSLKGKVQNGFTQTTEKGILVMLYSDLSDSVVYKSQPDYFAKTEKDGTFQINNIKVGKYKLVAVKDANANYKYDGESESIGFVNAAINVSEKQNILIDLFQEPAKKTFLKKYIHDSYGKVTLIFNQGSDSLSVRPINNTQKGVQEYLEFSKNNDTLTYWIKNFMKDSLILQVNNGNKVVDTVSLKFISREDAEKSKKHPLKLKLLSSPDGNQSFDLGSELVLKFSNIISKKEKLENVLFKEDTVLYKTKWYLGFSGYNEAIVKIGYWDSISNISEDPYNPGTFICSPEFRNFDLKENTSYHIFIPPGTFTDFFGLTNDSIKIDFKTKEEKFYGSVKLNLTLPSADLQYIVQLLDESGNIVRESIVRKTTAIEYKYLYPKKYKVKVIYDSNYNNKWDAGNYLQKTQPEKVIYNSELINIRSNWDAELDWKIDE
ncbi:Ig-like domain-containing protein [soil metagenome]